MGRLNSWLSRKARGEGVRPWIPHRDGKRGYDQMVEENDQLFVHVGDQHCRWEDDPELQQLITDELIEAYGDSVFPAEISKADYLPEPLLKSPDPDPYPLVTVCPRCDTYADAVDEIELTMRLVGPDKVAPPRRVQLSPCGCVIPIDEVATYRGLGPTTERND